MASRMMVSKEARTALEVKEMIVACEGVSGLGRCVFIYRYILNEFC